MKCKYYKRIRQVSYDGGITWSDTQETQKGDLYQSGSTDCENVVEPIYRWVRADGYICQGYYKCVRMQKQVSYDDGQTWEDTEEYMAGTVIEGNATECGYIEAEERWVRVDGYVCQGTYMLTKLQKQISYDSGATWEDTDEFSGGTVIKGNAPECGYVEPTETTRWVRVDGYICQGYYMCTKMQKQVSYDNGQTWEDTDEYMAGTVIKGNATECGYVEPEECEPEVWPLDDVSAYTASTVAQTISIGSFVIKHCEWYTEYYSYNFQGGRETVRVDNVKVLHSIYLEPSFDEVEFAIELPSSTYTMNWNVHLIFFDRNTNEVKKDIIIKRIKITRQ